MLIQQVMQSKISLNQYEKSSKLFQTNVQLRNERKLYDFLKSIYELISFMIMKCSNVFDTYMHAS